MQTLCLKVTADIKTNQDDRLYKQGKKEPPERYETKEPLTNGPPDTLL